MHCERVQDRLSDFLDGSLPESDLRDVDAHLRDCRLCLTVAEGLKETQALLRRLPREKAPPELIEGIRRRIAQEGARKPLWKRLFLPAHVKVPLEAAAAAVLFLLVYGSQTKEAPRTTPLPPAARVESAAPVAQGRQAAEIKKEKPGRQASTGVRPRSGPVPPVRASQQEPADSAVRTGAAEPAHGMADRPAQPQAQPSLPVVPAQRVSTAGGAIEPPSPVERRAEEPAAPGLFAAPPVRLARIVSFVRDVTIEVSPEGRPGLDDRIALAALRFGGSAQRGEPADTIRVRVPAASAEPFLAEVGKFAALPPEGARGLAAFPAGLAPDVAVFTVRIRVR